MERLVAFQTNSWRIFTNMTGQLRKLDLAATDKDSSKYLHGSRPKQTLVGSGCQVGKAGKPRQLQNAK